jgi:hypothetical protein
MKNGVHLFEFANASIKMDTLYPVLYSSTGKIFMLQLMPTLVDTIDALAVLFFYLISPLNFCY